MNWTGGRLQRSRNAGASSLSAKQRNHFAKARTRLQSSLPMQSPLKIEFGREFGREFWQSETTTGGKGRVVPSTSQPAITKNAPKTHRKRASKFHKSENLRSTSGRNHNSEPPSGQPINLQAIRSSLLQRQDWVGTAIMKHIQTNFAYCRTQDRIGKRQRITEEDHQSAHSDVRKTSKILKRQASDLPTKCRPAENHVDDISIRIGSSIHATQRTHEDISTTSYQSSRFSNCSEHLLDDAHKRSVDVKFNQRLPSIERTSRSTTHEHLKGTFMGPSKHKLRNAQSPSELHTATRSEQPSDISICVSPPLERTSIDTSVEGSISECLPVGHTLTKAVGETCDETPSFEFLPSFDTHPPLQSKVEPILPDMEALIDISPNRNPTSDDLKALQLSPAKQHPPSSIPRFSVSAIPMIRVNDGAKTKNKSDVDDLKVEAGVDVNDRNKAEDEIWRSFIVGNNEDETGIMWKFGADLYQAATNQYEDEDEAKGSSMLVEASSIKSEIGRPESTSPSSNSYLVPRAATTSSSNALHIPTSSVNFSTPTPKVIFTRPARFNGNLGDNPHFTAHIGQRLSKSSTEQGEAAPWSKRNKQIIWRRRSRMTHAPQNTSDEDIVDD